MLRRWLPIIGALLCLAALLGTLWWQLRTSRSLLLPSASQSDVLAVRERIDPADAALQYLREGDLHALQGEWSDARTAYAAAVGAHGGLPALRKLAQAQMQLGEQDDLRNTVEQMRAAGASGDDLGLLEVLFALRQGDLAGAQQHLGSLTPESPSQQYGQALLAILQGDHASAQQHLERVIAGNEPLLRPAARTLQDAYAEYLLFPESPNSHLVTLLGRALAQIQECALALPLLTQVTGMQVDYRDAWIMRGFCELGLQRAPEAIASFERAYALDPEKPETQYYLGRAYGRSGDHRNAVTYLSYAVRNGFQPEREARQALATQALALGDQTLALEQLTTILDLPDPQPEDLEAYVITAVQAGESAKAIERLRAQLALTPNDARLHDLLGLSLATNGDTEAARDALQRALDLNPRLESARQRLNAL